MDFCSNKLLKVLICLSLSFNRRERPHSSWHKKSGQAAWRRRGNLNQNMRTMQKILTGEKEVDKADEQSHNLWQKLHGQGQRHGVQWAHSLLGRTSGAWEAWKRPRRLTGDTLWGVASDQHSWHIFLFQRACIILEGVPISLPCGDLVNGGSFLLFFLLDTGDYTPQPLVWTMLSSNRWVY